MEKPEIIEFEIVKWEDYNPRKDRRGHTWFRLENKIASEPKFHGLTAAQRWVAVCLFAEVSQSHGNSTRLIVAAFADLVKVKESEVKKVLAHLELFGVVRINPGNQPVTTGDRAGDTRRDETDETRRTNETVSSEQGALAPELAAALGQEQGEALREAFGRRGVSVEIQKNWLLAYPDPEWVARESLKAINWEIQNPKKRKKNFPQFVSNWLSRDWDKHTTLIPSRPGGSSSRPDLSHIFARSKS